MASFSEAIAAVLTFVTTWISLPGALYLTVVALLWLCSGVSWAYKWAHWKFFGGLAKPPQTWRERERAAHDEAMGFKDDEINFLRDENQRLLNAHKTELDGVRAQNKEDIKTELDGVRAQHKEDIKTELDGVRAQHKEDIHYMWNDSRGILSQMQAEKHEMRADHQNEVAAFRILETKLKGDIAQLEKELDYQAESSNRWLTFGRPPKRQRIGGGGGGGGVK